MAPLYFAGPLALMGIVIAFFTYRYEKAKLALQAKKLESEIGGRAEIAQLSRRVAILERLVVDGDRKLADEIERLQREEEFRPGAQPGV